MRAGVVMRAAAAVPFDLLLFLLTVLKIQFDSFKLPMVALVLVAVLIYI